MADNGGSKVGSNQKDYGVYMETGVSFRGWIFSHPENIFILGCARCADMRVYINRYLSKEE